MLISALIGNIILCKGLQVALLPHFESKEKNLLMAHSIWKKGPEENLLIDPLCKEGLGSSVDVICSGSDLISSKSDIINATAGTIISSAEMIRSDADRISNLPECIKHEILVCLPIKEAVRTCILSKSWQYTWCMIPDLEVDTSISSNLEVDADISSKLDQHVANEEGSRITKFVDQLLNCHNNNLLKFKLSGTDLHGAVPVRWMQILSQKKVKELIIETGPNKFILVPTYNVHIKLELLVLRCCSFFLLPTKFDGRMLHTLDVRNCVITGDGIESLVSLCPLLQNLKFEHNFDHLHNIINIRAPNLRKLTIFGDCSGLCLMTPKLDMANFVYSESVSKMMEFRGNIIRSPLYIGHISISSIFGCFLQDPRSHYLKIMVVAISPSEHSIWSANIFFRNFSMLQKLVIYLEPVELSSLSSLYKIEDACGAFPRLREATIIPLLKSKTETVFEFAEIIVSRAPLLERLTIRGKMKDFVESKLKKISLSTKTDIIFDNPCLGVGGRFQGCCCSMCDITNVIDQ